MLEGQQVARGGAGCSASTHTLTHSHTHTLTHSHTHTEHTCTRASRGGRAHPTNEAPHTLCVIHQDKIRRPKGTEVLTDFQKTQKKLQSNLSR